MKNRLFILTLVIFMASSCQKDFLDTAPENTISNEQLAANPAALQAVLNGIYANLRTYGIGGYTSHIDYGLKGAVTALDMMGHDVVMPFLHWYGFFHNYAGRVQSNSRTHILWTTYYSQTAEANSVIAGIDSKTEDATAKALLGQALAVRGLVTFNTARIYAGTYIGNEGMPCIPLPDGVDFVGKPRATVSEVYTQIISDLESAVTLLDGFGRGTKQEINQAVAQGILARVYLSTGEWSKAAQMAAAARAGYTVPTNDDWLSGFADINVAEAMWGADIDAESSTVFASFFSHFDSPNGGYAGALGVYKMIDANLYSLISDTDIRKTVYVDPVDGDPNYPAFPGYTNVKFRDATFFEGDYIYMRASEMWLIEAEAKARMGDADAAAVLFELVSPKDASYVMSTATGDALVEEVYLQRRIELWGEGFSWYDLKRMQKPLMRDYPGSNHAAFAMFNLDPSAPEFLFQIPETEINANDAISISDQNP